jgi:hypothetical protein
MTINYLHVLPSLKPLTWSLQRLRNQDTLLRLDQLVRNLAMRSPVSHAPPQNNLLRLFGYPSNLGVGV